MSDQPPLARGATELLARAVHPDVPPTAAARSEAIDVIARALAARARARRARRAGAGLAAALAVAASIVMLVRRQPAIDGTPVQSVEGGAMVLHEGAAARSPRALAKGDVLVAPASGAVVLGSGTRIGFEGGSELGVASVGRDTRFELRTGSVRFDVAKLRSGERFVVRTVDSEIEVHGTSFSVALAAPDARCGATTTRVTVREGVVAVRYDGVEKRLTAGEVWPLCAAAIEPPQPPPSTSAPAGALGSAPKTATASDLAAQNDAFSAAMTARRTGDREGAIAAFDRLLHKWPSSPLAENAAAERMRLASGPRAVAHAKAYLARWPHGFAASEAKSIVTGVP